MNENSKLKSNYQSIKNGIKKRNKKMKEDKDKNKLTDPYAAALIGCESDFKKHKTRSFI